MLRRLSCLALALAFAASSVFSSAAWSADSFIFGGEEYEPSSDVALSDDLPVPDVYAAPRRAPRMVKVSAADQAAAETNTTGKLVVPATLPSSVDGTFQVMSKYYSYQPAQSTPPLPKFEADYWRDVVATFSFSPQLYRDYVYLVRDQPFVYSPSLSDPYEMIRGLALACNKDKAVFPKGNYVTGATADFGSDGWFFTVNYDVSSYSSSAFSLDGLDSYVFTANGPYWPSWSGYVFPLDVAVFVDGQQVLTLTRGTATFIDFGGYVYSGSNNVSTISFRWHMPFLSFVSDSADYAGDYACALYEFVLSTASNALTISFLDGQDVINAQNNKTKDDINKHEEYESQWTGSMTENFNKLDVGNFTFHSGLIAGFAMVSGIFMDLWRGMGDAAVVYVYPLTLGVVLMLLGRISRTGGKRGTEEGDDSS